MTLLFPSALALLAALTPVIVAFYLRRVRRRAATVSTLMFWERVLAEQPRRAFLGRLRRVLSLLLQLLLLALLGLALARPEVAGIFGRVGASGGSALVLVVDARAPMRAREADGRTRFERATEAARAFARRGGPRVAVAVLGVAGVVPRLLAPLAEDDRPGLAALDRLQPTDAGGAMGPALELAGSLLAARPTGEERRVIVFTDRPIPVTAATVLAGVPVETVSAADPARPGENVAVTRFGVRARPDSPQTFAASGEVLNGGTRRQRGEVELSLDGRLLDVRPFDLAPGERLPLSFPALATDSGLANARGWLRLRLRRPPDADPDVLPADDEARAALPPVRPLRVLLVSRGNWFLENLLRADAAVAFDLLDPAAFRPETAGNFDAVLLDDVAPARPDILPGVGNFLFLRQTPFDDPAAPPLVRPLVGETDPASPLLRLTNFRAVTLARAGALAPLEPPGSATVAGGWQLAAPVRAAEGDRPLVLTGERRGANGRPQRLVALPFGLTEGDLPLRVAFPLFMANTVRWLADADRPGDNPTATLHAGDPIRVAAGETLWTRPQTEARPAPGVFPAPERLEGPGVFEALDHGFYLLRRPVAAGGDRWLAVNPADADVSPVLTEPALAPTASPTTTAAAGWWERTVRARPPWVALALAAFMLSTLEWGLFHRRRTE